MPIDFTNISDTVIDGLEDDQSKWKPASEFPPPPDAGVYSVFIKQIRDTREKTTPSGPRLVVSYDAEIIGPKFEGRVLTFQWASNVEFMTSDRGRTSTLLDLVKSAGVKGVIRTNADFAKILNNMEGNRQYAFDAMNDWRGSCRSCYNQKLMELTGSETPELAALHCSAEQKREANNFAVKFKNHRQFPVTDNDASKRKDIVICSDCGDEIRAQANITRYLPHKG